MSWKKFQALGGVVVAIAVSALILSACQYASPAGVAALEAVGRQMLANGELSQEKFDAMMAALNAPGGPDWVAIAAIVGNYVVTMFGLPAFIKHQAKKTGSRLGGGTAPTP